MDEPRSYDLVILGGGAASFAAITEASGRGLSTAMVNTGLPLGGTCVNVGCVPSKHLLALGENAATPRENPFEAVRYSDGEPTVDWAAALDGTDRLVDRFRQSNYVDGTERRVTADALFVATGVQPNSEGIGLETGGSKRTTTGPSASTSTSGPRTRTCTPPAT